METLMFLTSERLRFLVLLMFCLFENLLFSILCFWYCDFGDDSFGFAHLNHYNVSFL